MDVELRLNENNIYVLNQMRNGLKQLMGEYVEDAVKHSRNIVHLMTIVTLGGRNNMLDLFETVSEDVNFLKILLRNMNSLSKRPFKLLLGGFIEMHYTLMFLTSATDSNKTCCEYLLRNEDFISLTKYVMDSEVDNMKECVVFIFNNIFFQTDCKSIKDIDLKTFLMERVEIEDERLCCVLTLLRILTKEEVEQFENEVCSILDKYLNIMTKDIEGFERLVRDNEVSEDIGIEELLKQLKPLSKCEKAKKELAKNEVFREGCKKLLTIKIFSRFSKLLKENLPLIYSDEELSHLKKEIQCIGGSKKDGKD